MANEEEIAEHLRRASDTLDGAEKAVEGFFQVARGDIRMALAKLDSQRDEKTTTDINNT